MAMIRPETEMKDSGVQWIGDIPSDWNIKPLYACLDEINQKNNPVVTTNILSLTNTDGVIPYSERGNQGNKSKENFEEYKVVYPNTIVANSMNILIGSVGLSKYEGCVSPVYYVYMAKPQVDIRYMNYLFQMEPFQKRLRQFANGILEIRLRVSSHDILHQKVAVPDYDEQQTIADYLDETCSKIDEIIAEAKASVDEYKELKQSVIFEAVTKGLDKNVDMKDSGYDFIGCIPSEWEMCKVRHLGTAQNGISIGGDAFGSGHPFVSYGDVYKNYSLPKTVDKLVQSSEEDRKRYSVEKGDWFFTRTSETIEEVGFSCVCEETIPDAVFAGFLIRVRPFNNRIYTGFAKYYFRSNHLRTFFVKEMNLVTRASLAQGLLKDAPVVVPPYDEQIEIANYLENKCEIIDGVIKDKEST
ncbi:MAG: restriction endonuclease subunit S, partial [Bulleidia sp.]|nr:restriction endonuclease subunit S [Bulleidia sp.]